MLNTFKKIQGKKDRTNQNKARSWLLSSNFIHCILFNFQNYCQCCFKYLKHKFLVTIVKVCLYISQFKYPEVNNPLEIRSFKALDLIFSFRYCLKFYSEFLFYSELFIITRQAEIL